MPAAVSAKEFLQALWGAQPGVAELTTIVTKPATEQHPRSSTLKSFGFNYPASLDSFLGAAQNHNRTADVYMGVCLRRQHWELGSRGSEALALSSNALWLDIDFAEDGHRGRTIPKLEAHKLISEFPRKPSIIVRTGGGIHAYWLLKEPALGAELWNVKKLNKALTKHFVGADNLGDLARIFRIPGHVNHKYDPPRPVEVIFWNPEGRYTLLDFDFLPTEDEKPKFSLVPEGPATAAPSPPPPNPEGSNQGPRQTPTTELDDEACGMAGKLFGQIWFEGYRHEMALCVSGWLAFAGVKYDCAVKIVQIASDIHKGDTKKRLRDVEDTYKKFIEGGEVKGRPTLEAMVDEAFPEVAKSHARKTLEAIYKLLPKPRGFRKNAAPLDFKILHLVKYTSQPAVWTVTIEKAGQKLITKIEHQHFMKYEDFCIAVLDQNTMAPAAALKNPEWRQLINDATANGLYEEKEAPREMRPAGAIEGGLEEFLAEAKENPDVGLLKKFPGYDEESTFFLLRAFQDFLDDRGRKFSQNQITEKLRTLAYESKVRRFGKKTCRVWMTATLNGLNGNGNGNGNGHGPAPTLPAPEIPKDQDTPPSDLFPDTPSGEGD